MAPVSASNSGDPWCMPRDRQPVMDGRPDLSSLDRRRTVARVASDQENDPLPGLDRGFEPAVDRAPGLVEVEPVEVEHPVGLDRAGAKAPVPPGIQGSRRGRGSGIGPGGGSRWPGLRPSNQLSLHGLRLFRSLQRFARKRPDRRRHLGPQRLFFRAERSHGRLCLLEPGSAPGPLPPFLQRSAEPGRQRPRRCPRDCFP